MKKGDNVNNLLIIGAGTFSVEIEELATILGYKNIAFLDDNNSVFSSPVIGNTSDIQELRNRYDSAIVALGNNEHRKRFNEELKKYGYNIPTLIHPTAYVSPDAEIMCGSIIRAKAVVSRYAKLGECVILNVGSLVDHHCEIGSYSHLLMGVIVRNCSKIPPLTTIHSNEVIE